MSQLKYKTRQMLSPQGKAKIYFCCHPEDYEKYLDSIANELLEKLNCAIWYLEDPFCERDGEVLNDISTCQLFVIPVTRKFLSSSNPALDTDFQLAKNLHIPVLPLMQDRDIVSLFNEKCGDLQFLDKYNTDETALDYNDKLNTFLSSVLIDDTLREKIRAAFDAYIFLSYRKQDRIFAQKLMQLIHKNDFCRDIAIWYDEFLTPGEDFNDAIKEALQKSKLFVMTVTPHLVSEKNYVMTCEYPMAQEQCKPILPVELYPTSSDALSYFYPNIPTCIKADNEPELSDALLYSLREIALRENDSSPEHLFFMGLAYLEGIDVEINPNRALELLNASAMAGCWEATEKLATMCYYGKGVSVNYNMAVLWQEKLVLDLYNHIWNNSFSRKNQFYYIDAVERLFQYMDGYCRYLLRTHQHELLAEKNKEFTEKKDKYSKEALEEANDLYEEKKNEKSRKYLIMCRINVAVRENLHGDWPKAEIYYQKAVELAELQYKKYDTQKNKHMLASLYREIGFFYATNFQPQMAEAYHQKTLDLLQDASSDYNEMNALASAYESISRSQGHTRKYNEEALDALEKAIAIRREIDKNHHDIYTFFKLKTLYNELGYLYEELGQYDKAQTIYEEAIATAETLSHMDAKINLGKENVNYYYHMAILAEKRKEYEAALDWTLKEVALHHTVLEESAKSNTQDKSINIDFSYILRYQRLADRYRDVGDFENAQNHYNHVNMLRREFGYPEIEPSIPAKEPDL